MSDIFKSKGFIDTNRIEPFKRDQLELLSLTHVRFWIKNSVYSFTRSKFLHQSVEKSKIKCSSNKLFYHAPNLSYRKKVKRKEKRKFSEKNKQMVFLSWVHTTEVILIF